MSNKYTIRNCPAIYQNFEDEFVCTSQIKVKSFPFYCQNCTDCVMKRIVDECKRGINNSQCNCGAIGNLVNILNTLDIEDIE